MQVVDIYEAQIKLCGLIEAALAGEQIVIADGNRFLVKLVPWKQHANMHYKPALMPQKPSPLRRLPEQIYALFKPKEVA